MSRQIVLYIVLSTISVACLALAFTINIHFIWLSAPSILLISQSCITGWLPNYSWLKFFSKVDQPKHTLLMVISRKEKLLQVLEVITPDVPGQENHSFAHYQTLKRLMAQHNKKFHLGQEANDAIYQQLHNQRSGK